LEFPKSSQAIAAFRPSTGPQGLSSSSGRRRRSAHPVGDRRAKRRPPLWASASPTHPLPVPPLHFPSPRCRIKPRNCHPIEAPQSHCRLLLDRPPPIAPRPIKGLYISAIFHRVQSHSSLCLSPARASCHQERIATEVEPRCRSLSIPVPPTADHGEVPLGPLFL
jgi:hypothetical protein